ncbi:MAG TPA: DinB family protein [Terriglobales bacterium]|nr:DinB family protein [Terriglobales bacterium]
MKETSQQYVKRILGHIDGQDPLKIQKSTANKLEKAIKHLSNKQLRKRPAPGKWSIAEILAHIADTEVVASWRMRLILGNDGAPIQGFDQDVWAKTFRYESQDPTDSLETFRVLREGNLSLLKRVPRKLWQNHGMHSERGKETIGHIVQLYAGHDLNHLQQVMAIAKNQKAIAKNQKKS